MLKCSHPRDKTLSQSSNPEYFSSEPYISHRCQTTNMANQTHQPSMQLASFYLYSWGSGHLSWKASMMHLHYRNRWVTSASQTTMRKSNWINICCWFNLLFFTLIHIFSQTTLGCYIFSQLMKPVHNISHDLKLSILMFKKILFVSFY